MSLYYEVPVKQKGILRNTNCRAGSNLIAGYNSFYRGEPNLGDFSICTVPEFACAITEGLQLTIVMILKKLETLNTKNMYDNLKSSGFTLVELLIIIVVIAILAAITMSAYSGAQNRAKDAALADEIQKLQNAVEGYNAVNGTYPMSATWGQMGLADSTAVWPLQNMKPYGVTAQLLVSPYDTSGSPNSVQEEANWTQSGHAQNGKIGWVSIIDPALDASAGHWTCFNVGEICTGYRFWWRTSDGVLHTTAGGRTIPSP